MARLLDDLAELLRLTVYEVQHGGLLYIEKVLGWLLLVRVGPLAPGTRSLQHLHGLTAEVLLRAHGPGPLAQPTTTPMPCEGAADGHADQ